NRISAACLSVFNTQHKPEIGFMRLFRFEAF
ncbi:hypothetical protein D018_0656, partial [Vibrio parahaemolyticus VP2007-007]